MRSRHMIWMAALVAATSCVDGTPAQPDPSNIGALAQLYLRDALDVMEFNSIRRYEIDWTEFRSTAVAEAEAAAAQTPADIHPVIVSSLERIGDNHSFFQAPASQAAAPGPATSGPAKADPSSQLLEPGVGYVDVPAFSGGGSAADSLALMYHQLIESVDTMSTVCRWVVDVRGNTGGNMWPMIAGLGPILGEDTVGFFVDPDTVSSSWFYDSGQAGIEDIVVATADPAYALAALPNVAVLHDSLTASSGEAVAVAFRGRSATRSFGEETWGVSTANAAFPLSDGGVIFLTVSTMADRTGTLYGMELVPDEAVVGNKTGDRSTDAALDAAVTWLNDQACS